MTILWVILALAMAYALYGAFVQSPYVRPLSGGTDRLVDGYLVPEEVVDPDEDEIARRVVAGFEGDSLRRPAGAALADPTFHEPHWGHTTGFLQATLEIDDIAALPEPFRVGLFATERSYPAVVRVNYVLDPDLKLMIGRMSIKIEYPEPVPNVYAEGGTADELDLLLIEGSFEENGAGRQFFARSARDLDMAVSMKPPSLATLKTVANWRSLARFIGILGTVRKIMAPLKKGPNSSSGWAGKPYFSCGPFALGPGAMKFGLTPRQEHAIAPIDLDRRDPTGPQKAAMEAWKEAGQDAEFDLRIQIATPDCLPEPGPGDPSRSVMAAEHCDVLWDEKKAPYVRVGKLTVSAAPEADLDQRFDWVPLQFNAWNTLPEMRPLGQLFRLRRHVHKAHSEARIRHLHGGTPGEMVGKCPFAGRV